MYKIPVELDWDFGAKTTWFRYEVSDRLGEKVKLSR